MADEFRGTGAESVERAATSSTGRVEASMDPAGTTDDGVRAGLQGRAHQLQQTARESGRDLLDQAVEKKDELKARAGTAVDDGRHRVSERAGSIARALHGTAQNLEMEGDAQLSHWVHQAADQVDRVVGYLNGRDASGLMHDVEDLARRNPALFLGGTYAAGLVLGRFLRASAPERRTEGGSRSAGTDDGRPGAYGAAPRGSVPLSGSADDAGFTDEDLREAWYDRDDRTREG